MRGLEAQGHGVVLARTEIAVGDHLGHLVDDLDRSLFGGSSQIEYDALAIQNLFGQEVYHVGLLHELERDAFVMELQVASHEGFAHVAD